MFLDTQVGTHLARTFLHPPRRPHHRTPEDFGLVSSATVLTCPDGTAIHSWLVLAQLADATDATADGGPIPLAEAFARGTVILGHGIGLTKSASLRQARLVHDLGFNALLFDHRNHGKSGEYKHFDHLAAAYSQDVETCVDYARGLWPHLPVIVWGFSFSTFITMYSLRLPAHRADGVIFDSGPGLDFDRLFVRFPPTGFNLRGAAAKLAGRPGAADTFARTTIDMLGATWPVDPSSTPAGQTPMLFLHGRDDPYIHLDDEENLAGLYPEVRLAQVGGGHLDAIKKDPDGYAAAVRAFLADVAPIRRIRVTDAATSA